LPNNENDGFMLFNMGNEYFALNKYKEALEYYEKAFKISNPGTGYTPKLIIRMAMCYDSLLQYQDEIGIIHKGLQYYPDYTDLLFLKGLLYYKLEKKYLPVNALKNVLKWEKPRFI